MSDEKTLFEAARERTEEVSGGRTLWIGDAHTIYGFAGDIKIASRPVIEEIDYSAGYRETLPIWGNRFMRATRRGNIEVSTAESRKHLNEYGIWKRDRGELRYETMVFIDGDGEIYSRTNKARVAQRAHARAVKEYLK
jgi:hypothetical protein